MISKIMQRFIEIPFSSLQQDTLKSLVGAYLTRQGYDTTETCESALDRSIEKVIEKMRNGQLVLIYDLDTDSNEIMQKADAKKWLEN